ncbi:efflux RND transporter periplasmic adaptor subunit [Parachitinimonas caeni]|uniref:Efflux RND transporter periplasmic adaptor subunit n=1 Tax=Parachitinimonas caeni TaxID=3031301 RepID=A0ABT7DV04_9NEIS|nr:efflux RND transporter periplasmic adaptor subunit [Parachitinimonas caeni]MDK2122918.1 efflux RND transporter periplasmic adaptor subunit [Parachitinimonas caeni]
MHVPHHPAFPKAPRLPAASLPLALAIPLLLTACGQKPGEAGHGMMMPPTEVSIVTVTPKEVPIEFEYVGQIAGSREVEVRSRVSGLIEKRLFTEGNRIKAGQALYQIDPAPFAAQLAAAEADEAMAKARLAQAERDLTRLKPLIEAKATSQKEADDATSAVDIAKAALKAAEARRTAAKLDMDHAVVTAPMDGVIGKTLKEQGSLVSAQGDSLLATMAQTNPAHVQFGVAEAEQGRVQQELASGELKLADKGFNVKVLLSNGSVYRETGHLDFSDYKADPATGTYAARASLANPDGKLAPGQFVRVLLMGASRPAALVVPQRSVLEGPTGKYVYVVGKGKDGNPAAEPRPVVVGDWVRLDGEVKNGWVIKQGLKAGDQVIVDGVARIFMPGTPVKPVAAGAQSAPPAPAAKS